MKEDGPGVLVPGNHYSSLQLWTGRVRIPVVSLFLGLVCSPCGLLIVVAGTPVGGPVDGEDVAVVQELVEDGGGEDVVA